MSFWNKTQKQDAPKPPQAVPATPPPPPHSPPAPAASDPIDERFSKVRSALGVGTIIQGKLSFDSAVRIDGKLSGDVFSSKALYVGKTGQVEAQIQAAALVVAGVVRGKITTSERIEILRGGELSGEVNTPVIVVEEGGVFSAQCTMPKRETIRPTHPQIEQSKDQQKGKPSK